MSLFRFFFKKPPDGLFELCDRVYVFDGCFTDKSSEANAATALAQLRAQQPDASFLAFDFRGGSIRPEGDALSAQGVTVMDYPAQPQACPVLKTELLHHFLRSGESWLALGRHNVLLMRCDRSAWPVLAFVLAALLIYRNQANGEQRTLDAVYKQSPQEILRSLLKLNPVPSQLRYLQYVSRRNVAASEWPPAGRRIVLDCVILRSVPELGLDGSSQPVVRVYRCDSGVGDDEALRVLYSTPKRSKPVRANKQAERELVKIDVNCHVEGDIVLECISSNEAEEQEEMIMFRTMFNTGFIRSNILILNRDEVDLLWDARDRFPKDFRAEIIFSEIDAATHVIRRSTSCFDEKEGLPEEAFAKVQEIFSHADWLDLKSDTALNMLQNMSASKIESLPGSPRKPRVHSLPTAFKTATMPLDTSVATSLKTESEPLISTSIPSHEVLTETSQDIALATSLKTQLKPSDLKSTSIPPPPFLSSNYSIPDELALENSQAHSSHKPHSTGTIPALPKPAIDHKSPSPTQPSPPPFSTKKSSPTPSTPPAPFSVKKSSSVPSPPAAPPPPPGPAFPSKQPLALSSADPPPAPALPSFGTGKGRLSRTISSKSNCKKLKPLHWMKITRAAQGSLWAESQNYGALGPEIDMSELETLFSAALPLSAHARKSIKRGSAGKTEKVQLIEHRRAYNCEIMLSKVKVPLDVLMSSVLALEDSALDSDQVENLIKFCPTQEEMELLKGYTGKKENLGRCEQFFLELMQVPRVESKLRVFSFKKEFQSQVSYLRRSLNVVNDASEEIRNSIKLKRIMQTILSLGNALNQGTARGSAIGFKLDSLLKLAEIRARNNKMTLMHYLCKVLAEKLPEVIDFSKALGSLESAAKIQLKILAEEMQAITKGLEKVVQELSTADNDGPISEYFCKSLKEFLLFAEAEVRSLTLLYSSVGKNMDALVLYFGEDLSRFTFEQVVSTLVNFTRMFNKAHEENCKEIERELKKAAENEKLKIVGSHKLSKEPLHTPILGTKIRDAN